MSENLRVSTRGDSYRFGIFVFDPAALELRKDGRVVRVRPQSLKLLTLLLSRAGEVVSRDEIQRALWGDETFVDYEQGVNHAVRELRSVLGDSAESPRFIQTLARRGYRFLTPVERLTPGERQTAAALNAAPLPGPAGDPSHAAEGPTPTADRRRWVLAASVLLAGLAIAAAVLGLRQPGTASATEPQTIAVVPFASPETDPAFGAGLAVAISTRLAGQQRAFVRSVPAASASSPRHWSQADLRGATLVLSGEVFRHNDEVTVVARLENISTAATVWTEQFRFRAGEFHNFENVVAERVADALDLRVAAAEQERLRRRYTDNPAAYEDYLRGRALLVQYTPEGALGAVEAFEAALRRDTGYALARAGLAMACADMYLRFAASNEVERWGQRADAEARAALELDDELPEAHLARAAVARKREFDWNLAINASRRALVLNPNLDQAHFIIAAAYYHSGYMEEALLEVKKGLRLRGADVLEPTRIQGIVALWSGDYGPARVHLDEVSRISGRSMGDTYQALSYYYSGNVDQALRMLHSLAEGSPASTASRAGAALASVLASRSRFAEARVQLDRVLKREYRDHHVAYNLGTSYAQLGDSGEAIRWLRTAADTGLPCPILLERDPLLEPLRTDSKFAELLAYVRSKRETVLRQVP
jgi:DNA-binding winged helix-turn-helix (wHTH) protein/tetratricopeptide (TPR) repeat protein